MRRVSWLVGLVAVGSLGGCGTMADKPNLIPQSRIEAAQANIAEQLAVYIKAARQAHQTEAQDTSRKSNKDTWCGNGEIDFDIGSVKVDLLTTLDSTAGVTGEAKVPVAVGVVPDFKGGVSNETTNSQELSYTTYLLPDQFQPTEAKGDPADSKPVDLTHAPIAQVILNQRSALIQSAKRSRHPNPQACGVDFNPVKPSDSNGQLVIGLKGVDDGSGGISISLGFITLGGTVDNKNTNGSTITVNFQQQGLTANTVITPCYNDHSTPCVFTPLTTVAPARPVTPVKPSTVSALEPAPSEANNRDYFMLASDRRLMMAAVSDSSPAPSDTSGIIRMPDGTCIQPTPSGVYISAACPPSLPIPKDNPQCIPGGGVTSAGVHDLNIEAVTPPPQVECPIGKKAKVSEPGSE